MALDRSRKRSTPALDSAIAFLRSLLAGTAATEGARLASTKELAAGAGVSLISMHKAIAQLRAEGVLATRTGKGIYAGARIPPISGSDGKRTGEKHEQCRSLIIHDIFSGKFKALEFLPSCKELMERYGVGRVIVRKAMTALCRDGVVTGYKRRFRIAVWTPARRPVIYCISGQDLSFSVLFGLDASWYREFSYALEHECGRRGIELKAFGAKWDPAFIDNKDSILGFVVWPMGDLSRDLAQRIPLLLPHKRPVFIYDEGREDVASLLPKSQFLHIFRMDDHRAGFEIGKHLIAHGHRKACLFASGDNAWTRNRLTGMRKAFSLVGLPDAVKYFSASDHSGKPSYVTPADVSHARFLGRVQGKMNHLSNELVRYCKELPNDRDQLEFAIRWAVWSIGFRHSFVHLFREALATAPQTTAWVGGDDFMAIYGISDFLKGQPRPIRDRIAVAGFNDIIEAFHAKLTSYKFDFAGMAASVMNLMIFPSHHPQFRSANGTIPIPGWVSERESSVASR